MDEDGQVIGVATLQSVEGQNLNFAIAVEQVSEALGSLTAQTARNQEPSYVTDPSKAYPTPTPYQGASGIDSSTLLTPEQLLRKPPTAPAFTPYQDASGIDSSILLTPEQLLHKPPTAPAFTPYSDASGIDSSILLTPEQLLHKPLPTPTPLWDTAPASDARVYFERGMVSLSKHEYANAISDFTEVIRIDNDASAYNNRGLAYFCQGKIEKSISDYSKAIRIAPNLAICYWNRARAYLRIGNRAKANADIATARRLKGNQ